MSAIGLKKQYPSGMTDLEVRNTSSMYLQAGKITEKS